MIEQIKEYTISEIKKIEEESKNVDGANKYLLFSKIVKMIKEERSYYYDRKDNVVLELVDDGKGNFLIFAWLFGENINKLYIIRQIDDIVGLIEDKKLKKEIEKKWKSIKENIYYIVESLPIYNEKTKKYLEDIKLREKDFVDEVCEEMVKLFKTKRFKLRNEHDYYIIASFVIASWIKEIFERISYLAITGTKGAGKTTILESLSPIAYKTLLSSNISPASIPRLLDLHGATLCLDEVGKSSISSEEKEEFFRLLRSGISQKETYIRVEEGRTKVYRVFGFKFLSLSFDKILPEDIEDRSLKILTIRENFISTPYTDHEKLDLIMKLTAIRIHFLLNRKKYDEIIRELEFNLKELDARLANNLKYLFLFSPLTGDDLSKIVDRYYKQKIEKLKDSEVFKVLFALMEYVGLQSSGEDGNSPLLKFIEKREFEIFISDFVKFYLSKETGLSIEEVERKFFGAQLLNQIKKISELLESSLGFEIERKISTHGYTKYIIKVSNPEIIKRLNELAIEQKNAIEITKDTYRSFIEKIKNGKKIDLEIKFDVDIEGLKRKVREMIVFRLQELGGLNYDDVINELLKEFPPEEINFVMTELLNKKKIEFDNEGRLKVNY